MRGMREIRETRIITMPNAQCPIPNAQFPILSSILILVLSYFPVPSLYSLPPFYCKPAEKA
jgi:hypothetical protein